MSERETPRPSTASRSDEPVPDAVADLPFEVALARLEQVVDRLEQGEPELEASLADFEEGVRLSKHCARLLAEAESRIEILTREGDGWVTRTFDEGDDGASGESGDEGEPEESE